MKKSSIAALVGLIGAIVTLAAANGKLKSEYEKNNIQQYLAYTELPPFHFVKDNYTGEYTDEWYTCNIISGKQYSIGTSFDVSQQLFSYTVKNDTLLIERKKGTSFDIAYGVPLIINCGPLKGISARSCNMTVTGKMADSISATAVNKATIKFEHLKTAYLKADADKNASISISATDTLQRLSLQLKSHSSFAANNVYIINRNLQLGDSASLQLSGKSLQTFGIGKN